MKQSILVAAFVLAGISTVAAAQSMNPGGQMNGQGMNGQGMGNMSGQGMGGGHHRGPPPEAIAACKGKSSGDDCSFTGRNSQNITGTCFAPPSSGQQGSGGQGARPLACRPANMGPGMGGGGMGGGMGGGRMGGQ